MKFSSIRGAQMGAALGLFGLVSGCSSTNPSSTSGQSTSRELAAAWLAAQGYDRAQTAIRRDDARGLKRADADLRRAAAGTQALVSLAKPMANDGSILEDLASRATGSEKNRLRELSAQKYRGALAFVPSDAREKQILASGQIDPETLNALGYFLANRGQNRGDFERAARLTQAALRGYDKLLGTVSSTNPARAQLAAARAQGPQDSYAWALFKLGRFAEARREQQQVIATLARSGGTTSADIPFHLAEILRAQGERDGAIRAYQQALEIGAEAELRAQIELGLNALGVGLPDGGKII